MQEIWYENGRADQLARSLMFSPFALIAMSNPLLWYAFIGLFAAAGCMNLARGLSRTDARRAVNLTLSASSFLWAATAGLFRFVGPAWGYMAGAAAMAVMLWASLLSMKAAR